MLRAHGVLGACARARGMSTRRPAGFPKARAAGAKAEDGACMRWLGIPSGHAWRIVVLGMLGGAAMEAFMVKAWIGQTNFYEVVKRKEAERRAETSQPDPNQQPSFGELVKTQWEQKKREAAAAAAEPDT